MNHKLISYRLVVIGIFVAAALVGMLYVDQVRARASSVDQTVLFSDDFSGDLSQWNGLIGDWSIDQGELVGTGWGSGTDAYIYAGETSWTDYALQAKVIFVDDNAILVLRSSGRGQNEYLLYLWQQGGEYSNTYEVSKYQDGVYYTFTGGFIPSPVTITNPSVVQVQVSGNRLFLFINGVYMDEIVDPDPLTNGRIGLGVIWDYTSRFDDVVVTTLPPIMMLPPQQDKFGEAGDTVAYTVEVENHTGFTDSFDLEVLPGNTWTTTLSTDLVGPIVNGESITFTAWVNIPPGAQTADSDSTTIQATSVTSPSFTATAMITSVVTSGELAYVPMGDNDSLALIDTVLHTTIGSIDMAQYGCDFPRRARLTPDGTELYVICDSSNIIVLETTNLSLVATIDNLYSYIPDLTFVQFGAYALTNSGDTIDVIDTATHTIVRSIGISPYSINTIAAHPYLPLAYAAGDDFNNGCILVIDTNTFTIKTVIHSGSILWGVVVSPDGHWVYAGDEFGDGLFKINASTNTVVDTLPGYGRYGLEISPDGSKIYASEGWDMVIDVIDTDTMDYITTISVGGGTFENELTCDGSELYITHGSYIVPVVDTQTYNVSHDIYIPGVDSMYGTAICPQYVGEGAYLSPPSQGEFAEAGETVPYTLWMINLTGGTDSFNLEVLPGNTWTTTLPTDFVGPIEDRTSVSFTAWVEVPPAAQPGDSDAVTIQATSVTSPTLTATAMITTTVTSGELAYVPMDDSDGIALIDTVTHTTIGSIDMAQYGCDYPQRARLTPDGAELYVMCDYSGNILIFDTTDLSLIATIERPGVCQQDVTFVQFGAYALASTSYCFYTYQIDVIDTATHTIVQSIPTSGYGINSITAHPFLPLAYAAGTQLPFSSEGAILVIDTNTFTVQTIIPYGGNVWDVQPSPDGHWVYASDSYSISLAKIDVNTNTIVDTLPGYGYNGLDISPDGSTIYASQGGIVIVIDAVTLDYITSIDVGTYTYENELTCDGSELYVARNSASVPVIDTQTYNISYEIPIPSLSSEYGIAICPQYVAEGAFLNPPEQAKDGGRGEAVDYQETLCNNSGITETFDLQALGNLWETQLSPDQIGPLSNGESASFTITVIVPVDAPWYDTDNATILATGVTSPALTAEAQFTTTAFAPAQISVDPDSLQSTQIVGEVTSQTMTISNGPGVTLTYDISVGTYPGNVLSLHLDELQGSTTFYDQSGYGNNATCSGDTCPDVGVPGAVGTALSFDGIDDYIQIPHNAEFDQIEDQDKVTIAAWVNVREWVGDESAEFLINEQYDADSQFGWGFHINPSQLVFTTNWSGDHRKTCSFDFNLNDWYYVAVAYDRSLGTVQFYVNDMQICNTSFSGDILDTSGEPMYIGYSPTRNDEYSNGLIDELYIFDRALSAEEIIGIYQNGLGKDVPWLSVDPVSGSIPTNDSALVQVTFDATGVQPGLHETALFFYSNDPLQPLLSIPVSLTVEPTADMGQVSGTVSDAWTGDPLAAIVELLGVYTMTANPDYGIWAVEGTYSLTAHVGGYVTVTLPVEILAGEVTVQDVALEPALPRLGELPDQISISLRTGFTGTQALELANNGPLPLDFAFHEINPLRSLGPADGLMGKHILYDRAHDQHDLSIYTYLTSDLVGAGATIDENFDPFDEYTLVGYDILWLNGGITYWTSDELQILEDWLAGGGAILIQSQDMVAVSGPAGIFGITYQDGNCNYGTTTNINPHPVTEGVDEFYIEWSCEYITGSPVEVILDQHMTPHVIAAEQGAGKMVVVAYPDFLDSLINYDDNRLLALNAFQWLAIPVYGDIIWLSETPGQGSIPGHSSLATTLGFDATGLTPGVYDGFLAVEHNDPNQDSPVIIPVQLTVTTQVAPAAVTITGPGAGMMGESQSFTATVEPISTTLPLTYTWQASGLAPVTHTGGLTDTVSFTWEVPGTQVITVTASNQNGSVMDTHVITITDVPISGLVASNDSPTLLGSATTLSATVTAGSNIIYSWDFGDGESGGGAVVTHTYPAAGIYTATVTATNSANTLTVDTIVTITAPMYDIYLPLVIKSPQAPLAPASSLPGGGVLVGLVVCGAVGRWKKRG